MSVRWDELNHLARSIFRSKTIARTEPKRCAKFVVYRLHEDRCALCKRPFAEHRSKRRDDDLRIATPVK